MFGRKDHHPGTLFTGFDSAFHAGGLFVDLIDDVPQYSIRLGLEDDIVVSIHEEGDELVGTEQVYRLKMGLQLLVLYLAEKIFLLDCLQEPSFAGSKHRGFFVPEGLRVELRIFAELLLH